MSYVHRQVSQVSRVSQVDVFGPGVGSDPPAAEGTRGREQNGWQWINPTKELIYQFHQDLTLPWLNAVTARPWLSIQPGNRCGIIPRNISTRADDLTGSVSVQDNTNSNVVKQMPPEQFTKLYFDD